MDIFDFITQDEIDDLPDDDPSAAFTEFARIAQRRLNEETRGVHTDDEQGWRIVNDARHGFVNVVVAAAKKYEIEPFASLEVPRVNDFGSDDHRQFRADLDHYLTQLVLDNGSRRKRASVSLAEDVRASIRGHVHEIKLAIDKADLTDAKRAALLKCLSEFEAELEKRRLNLMAVTLLTITLAGAPGSIAATGELLGNIWRAVAEAKLAENESKPLIADPRPLAITGPRNEGVRIAKGKRRVSEGPRESFNQDLDDEIPF